jgi:acetyltransferase-like isoleucine patch superfamily enzyme
MKIGLNSYINSTSILLEKNGKTITIGDNVAIGHWCYISTQMHKTENHREWFSGDIIIKDNVWVGNGVVVYPNVTIGENCVIGAHVVVTHDVPPNTKIYNTYKTETIE